MGDERQDRTYVKRQMGQAYARWYWARRHMHMPEGFAYGETKAQRVGHILEYRRYRALLKTAPPETNERGNQIYRDEDADRYLRTRNPANSGNMDDRYYYDFKALTRDKGWQQWDTSQDAWYFGVWVNLAQRMTFTYAEGDRTLVVCQDDEHLRAELQDMAEFYGAPPPAFICYDQDRDTKQWTRTEVYDTRPSL